MPLPITCNVHPSATSTSRCLLSHAELVAQHKGATQEIAGRVGVQMNVGMKCTYMRGVHHVMAMLAKSVCLGRVVHDRHMLCHNEFNIAL